MTSPFVEIGGAVGAEESRERDGDGVAGAAWFGLLDELDGEMWGGFGLDGLYHLGRSIADDDSRRALTVSAPSASRTYRTIGRPHSRCNGFGVLDRIRCAFARGEHDS